MPSTNNIDTEFLAQLYRESHISKIKSTDAKKKKWQGIAIKYCDEKNLPLMDYKILMRKWSKLVSSAQRNRSKGVKSARATGGGPSTAPKINPLSEIVLAAAEANADLESEFDCEPNYGNRVSDRNEDNPIGSATIDDEMQSQSILQDPLNNEDNEMDFSQQIGSAGDITFNFDNTQEDEQRIDERSDSISPPPVITSPVGASILDREEADGDHINEHHQESDGGRREENVTDTTTAAVTTASVTTATVTTPSGAPKRSYVRRSTALGQFYMNRTEQEESALDKISAARKEAAEQEKKLQAVLLRTAEDEEKAKREMWVIKKATAEKEKKIVDQKKDMIELKKKILEAEYYTALVKRNHAIHEYNKLTGHSVPIPQLPNID